MADPFEVLKQRAEAEREVAQTRLLQMKEYKEKLEALNVQLEHLETNYSGSDQAMNDAFEEVRELLHEAMEDVEAIEEEAASNLLDAETLKNDLEIHVESHTDLHSEFMDTLKTVETSGQTLTVSIDESLLTIQGYQKSYHWANELLSIHNREFDQLIQAKRRVLDATEKLQSIRESGQREENTVELFREEASRVREEALKLASASTNARAKVMEEAINYLCKDLHNLKMTFGRSEHGYDEASDADRSLHTRMDLGPDLSPPTRKETAAKAAPEPRQSSGDAIKRKRPAPDDDEEENTPKRARLEDDGHDHGDGDGVGDHDMLGDGDDGDCDMLEVEVDVVSGSYVLVDLGDGN